MWSVKERAARNCNFHIRIVWCIQPTSLQPQPPTPIKQSSIMLYQLYWDVSSDPAHNTYDSADPVNTASTT
jgi:hypothetical protein